MIEDRALKAMNLIGSIKPYKINGPVEIKVEFTRTDYCDNASERPNVERIDARTVIKNTTDNRLYVDIIIGRNA